MRTNDQKKEYSSYQVESEETDVTDEEAEDGYLCSAGNVLEAIERPL